MIWTDEQKQEVATLWQSHSAAEIADIFRARGFNITRNSIIGLAFRGGLSKPAKEKKERKPRKPRSAAGFRKPAPKLRIVAAPPSEPAMIDVALLNMTLSELGPNNCRYIAGEPAEAMYCGHPIHKHSFCLAHFHLCYVPPAPRKANPGAFSSGFRARAA